jgi:hypothetical protein
MQGSLDEYVKLYGIYDLIIVADLNGNLVATNSADPSGRKVNFEGLKKLNFKDQPWFQAVVKGDTTDDKADGLGGTFVEGMVDDNLLASAFGTQQYATSFSAAVKNAQGAVIGVITNRANVKWISGDLLAKHESLNKESFTSNRITILDNEMNVIADVADGAVSFERKGKVAYESSFEFPQRLSRGEEQGVFEALDPASQNPYLYGFSKVHGPKFTEALGWNTLVKAKTSEVFAASDKITWFAYGVLGFFSLLAIVFAAWFSNSLANRVIQFITSLTTNSQYVTDASSKIASSSVELSEAAVEQAAALQETMAAVDEIGATVEKNAESANKSKVISSNSRESAEAGKRTVDQMLKAIADISESNE